MLREFEDYPKYKKIYIRAFDEMLCARHDKGLKTTWKSGQEVFDWWTKERPRQGTESQRIILSILESNVDRDFSTKELSELTGLS